MEFRQAAQSDLEAVCTLYRRSRGNPFSVWNEEYPTLIEAAHDLETGNLFVLVNDMDVVGTISIVPENEMDNLDVWQYSSGSHGEIARVAILPEHQGKGLSCILVSNIFQVLRKRGLKSVRLSVACCNIPAYKTYHKLGFELRGEAVLYGSEYYLMEKML